MVKISACLPVYKTEEKYLRECIESVLGQTFQDFELLILDDCPEQPVKSIVESYHDKRIKYMQVYAKSGKSRYFKNQKQTD